MKKHRSCPERRVPGTRPTQVLRREDLPGPHVIYGNLIGIVVLAGLGMTRNAYDLMKFGRKASYHMWSAKF
jgi:hypothetical protein